MYWPLPDFSREFVFECHASGVEIKAVLSQQKHPTAFMSKTWAQSVVPRTLKCNFINLYMLVGRCYSPIVKLGFLIDS